MDLTSYISPDNETSLWKDVPIDMLDDVQGDLRSWAKLLRSHNKRIIYRFRGKRRRGLPGQMTCLKKDANRFAIYIVSDYPADYYKSNNGYGTW